MKPNRIYILGISGSGKSFLGKILSKQLKIPHYDSDDVRFIKKFSKARTKDQRKILIDRIIKKKKWILDAKGSDWDRHAMKKSELVIWLQITLTKRLYRILKRYYARKGEFEEDISSLWELVKFTSRYRYGGGVVTFKEHKRFLEENKIKYIAVKNKKQLEKIIGELK